MMSDQQIGDVRINTENEQDLRYWAVQLHITCHELKEAIQTSGTKVASKIEAYIQKHKA
jgi:hypothetical protein